VVVNPFLVFDEYMGGEHGKEPVSNKDGDMAVEDFTGWCVLNSNANDGATKMKNGFSGSEAASSKPISRVRLFLNICASYLKAKRNNQGNGRQAQGYIYEEPFGPFTDSKGTEEFPRFDFPGPSIVQQSTSNDCGLAVVANSMAVVNHLEHVPFATSSME
jgi:hypothetical protein